MSESVRATDPPSMAVRFGDTEILIGASHPLLNRTDLIVRRGRELVVVGGELTRPERAAKRPPIPAAYEFLAYVYVYRAVSCILDRHIDVSGVDPDGVDRRQFVITPPGYDERWRP